MRRCRAEGAILAKEADIREFMPKPLTKREMANPWGFKVWGHIENSGKLPRHQRRGTKVLIGRTVGVLPLRLRR